MIKALFLDIDGTLVSFTTHRIPDSTVEALTEARRRGVKVFIATGRPPMLINNLHQIEHLIDGYVTTNGALCRADGLNLHKTMPTSEVLAVKAEADRLGAMLITVGLEKILLCNPDTALVAQLQQLLNVPDIAVSDDITPLAESGVIQMTAFVTADQEPRLLKNAPHCVATRWHPAFADITADNADKALGIAAIAQRYGFSKDEIMTFGDGGNDIPMLRYAGTGVAMGNALDEVKAAADYVTSSVDDDGVRNALQHFGIIE